MENKRSFFSFFARGVTTTHPLCSVFTLLICSVFLFICITVPTAVSAEAFPMPPVWLPLNPYNAQGLEPNFKLLSDDQKAIVEEILGAYGTVYLGLASNPIDVAFNSSNQVRLWWREFGGHLLNVFFQSTVTAPRAMQDLVGSVTYKASTYDSYSDYVSDTEPSLSSSSPKYFQFTPELTVAMKNWFAAYGGVYDFQFRPVSIESIGNWQYNTGPYYNQTEYNNQVSSNLFSPIVRANSWYNYNPDNYYRNVKQSHSYFSTYCYLFLNTSNGTANLVDINGNKSNEQRLPNTVSTVSDIGITSSNSLYFIPVQFSISGFSTISAAVEYIFTNSSVFSNWKSGSYNTTPCLNDFVKKVYVGADWSSKREYDAIDDLNIGLATSNYIDNVDVPAWVDINGLLGSIGSDLSDVRQGIIENTIVQDGTQAKDLTEAMLKAIDKYITEPSSGVVIPIGLFAPFTKYITYLWQQTQPLILYVRDLITALTFDGQGISWVFFGAVSTGLIGGVICKFLL